MECYNHNLHWYTRMYYPKGRVRSSSNRNNSNSLCITQNLHRSFSQVTVIFLLINSHEKIEIRRDREGWCNSKIICLIDYASLSSLKTRKIPFIFNIFLKSHFMLLFFFVFCCLLAGFCMLIIMKFCMTFLHLLLILNSLS